MFASSADSERSRVLVVDDDPCTLETVATRLDLAGYRTFRARDGFEALHRLSELRPAGMILDINMPKLDGFGVLKELKARRAVPVSTMVLTARSQPEDVKRAIDLGAADFLAKPFDDRQLLTRVARMLGAARADTLLI